VWSDVVCPWCAIGQRRLEAALAGFEHGDEVEVVWRAFELDPSAPLEREGDVADHIAGKYGRSREEAQAGLDRMTALAAEDGLDFHFERARGGATFDAHRLVHLALVRGGPEVQGAVKHALFSAYLTEGLLVSDHDVLRRIGVEAGLDADQVAECLASGAFAEDVWADESVAHQLGVSGVPFFVIDRRYGVSGAQPAEVLRGALERAWADRVPAIATIDGAQPGGACDGDACDL